MSAQRGRLGAYALWQLRDYMFGPGFGTALVAMIVLIPMFITKSAFSADGTSPRDMSRMMGQMFDQLIALVALTGPILGAAGIASADRHPGLSRFLFAKPVRVDAYYLQAWVVRGFAFFAIAVVLGLVVNAFMVHVPMLELLAVVAVAWLLIGGLGLLVSALVPRDVAVLFLIYMVPVLLDSFVDNSRRVWWWVKPLLTILPPTHKLEELRHAMLTAAPVVAADLWHVMLYGGACVVLGTYLVRRLPLVR
ncbi:MAG TPA: hypothetical protein VJR92_04735 [Gemmatimonadaceae bacterium]|nr:hypothetical protein [Gemmatimonadaceae bacterium]